MELMSIYTWLGGGIPSRTVLIRLVAIAIGVALAAGCEANQLNLLGDGPQLMPVENLEQFMFPGQVSVLAFSQEGHAITAGGCETANGEEDCIRSIVQVWNVERGNLEKSTIYAQPVTALAISPDGKQWVGGDSGGRLGLLKATPRDKPKAVHQKREITTLAFSPDGKWVASGSMDPSFPLCFLDMKTGGVIKVKPQFEPVSALAFSPDSRVLAVGTTKGRFYVWNFSTSREPTEIDVSSHDREAITRTVFSSDGQLVGYGRRDGRVVIINQKSGQIQGEFHGASAVNAMAFSPDRLFLALGQDNGKLMVLDSVRLKPVWYKRHIFPISDLAYSPDGLSLAVAVKKRIFLYRMYGVSDKSVLHTGTS